ncbi:MAG: histidine phosphatase family protein [Actinomycetota bacterium]|nr:histidine phosphatase family protein [Actinomycetota bacterium]
MLLLVRHGETEPNRQGLLLGRADPPLTARGRSQGAALAASLPRPHHVISSPLHRATDTAAAFGRPFETDERWIELDYGDLDGRPAASVSPEVWSRFRADPDFAPAGGESLAALGHRVRSACDDIAGRAGKDVVIIVTHVSPIKAALAWALDAPDTIAWRTFVEDASVSRIDIEPDGPVVRWFNRGVLDAPLSWAWR